METTGRCQKRDVAYTNTNPITVPLSLISNELSGSFCIAITTDTTATNAAPIMVFLGTGGASLGGITLAGSTISVNIAGQTAQFNVTTTGHQSFQLCSNGSTLTLYQFCTNPQTVSFGPTSLSNVVLIEIYGSSLNPDFTFKVSIYH